MVTQPRRVAARAAANRLAQLTRTRVGEIAGFTVRGEREMNQETLIEMVTPGILLRRLLVDPSLEGVGAVILDEVHERGLDTDLLVGLLAEVRAMRPDLAVVAMSATVDAAGFASILGAETPVLTSPGLLHPVTERWVGGPLPLGTRGVTGEFLDHVASTVDAAFAERPDGGDVLVFVPGVREVRHVAAAIRSSAEVLGTTRAGIGARPGPRRGRPGSG